VQWLGPTTVVYRVSNGSETADYAVSVDGGSSHKIADVALTMVLLKHNDQSLGVSPNSLGVLSTARPARFTVASDR
jgi:hypothetical protein